MGRVERKVWIKKGYVEGVVYRTWLLWGLREMTTVVASFLSWFLKQ